jgi:hypothetical protein
MSINALIAQIVRNPEGGTVSLVPGVELPTSGYFVGGVVSPLIVDTLDSVSVQQAVRILDTIEEFVERVRALPLTYLGWWTDEESGKLYVDGTTWHADRTGSLRIGRSRGEIAIFDVVRKTSIYLVRPEEES